MTLERAHRLKAEAERRASQGRRVDPAALCFPKQRAFVEDESKFVAGLCGRRGGKTDGAVLKLLKTALTHRGAVVPYITLSRPQAKRNAWPKLMFWDRELDLGAKFNHADLTMTLPQTGSTIQLGGANDEAEIERYRGGAYPAVVLDEAQSFRPFIRSFIQEILAPALLDYDGQLVLIGTPNSFCYGYFHDATNSESETPVVDADGQPMYSVHRWTAFDNPNIDDRFKLKKHSDVQRALIEGSERLHKVRKASGLTVTDPAYRREYLAEWVRSDDQLVYNLRPYNIEHSLPTADDLQYVLGMDVGYVDATAFVVMAFSRVQRRAWVVESFQETEMLPTQQMAEATRLHERYGFVSIVIDPGGGGKGVVEELSQRHGIPASVAQKSFKMPAIQTLNADLKAGRVTVVKPYNEELLFDLSRLRLDMDRLRRRGGAQWRLKPINHMVIDDRTPDHLADAFLYAHRECLHYLSGGEEREGPTPGTPEWIREQEEALFRSVCKKVDGTNDPWWKQPPPRF